LRYRFTVAGSPDEAGLNALDPISVEHAGDNTAITIDVAADTPVASVSRTFSDLGPTVLGFEETEEPREPPPQPPGVGGDPEVPEPGVSEGVKKKTRKRALIEGLIVLAILFFIFVILLPQFIDYGQVIESMRQLTWGQVILLSVLGLVRIWFEAGVYNVLIPGLRWWPGFKAWAASNSVAFFAPPGVDLAIRFGMYRSVGISGEAAGAGIVLSWFFTTGIKLVLPIVALLLIVLDGFGDDTVVVITLVAVAALIAGVLLIFLILYRERIAFRLGSIVERWYNGLIGGRWKFEELAGLAERMVAFRGEIVGTLSARWLPATLVTFVSQAIFFIMLVLSMRFMGVTSEMAGWEIIFDAYAVGLLFSLIPILPAGLGVVEVVYVGMIAGESGTDLANAVMAGAFVHRIFTWLLPILIGIIPLSGWRRQMQEAERAEAAESDTAGHD